MDESAPILQRGPRVSGGISSVLRLQSTFRAPSWAKGVCLLPAIHFIVKWFIRLVGMTFTLAFFRGHGDLSESGSI